MAEQLIAPHQTKWEKFRKEVSSFSPNVKAALIGAPVALLVAVLGLTGGCLKVSADNAELRKENAAVRSKVHDLEQEIAPFKNLAVQEFRSADAASLKKLADLLTTLRNDLANEASKRNELLAEIDRLRKSVPRRRHISQAHGEAMIEKLKLTNYKSTTIHTQAQDVDTQELARVIANVFALSSIQPGINSIGGFFAHGVRVVVKNANDAALQAALKPLFESIGEAPNFQEDTALDETTVHVYVGAAFPMQ